MTRRRFGKVRRLPSGRWQASYIGPDGHRRSAGKTFGNRGDAGRWLALVETEILRGTWTTVVVRRYSVGEWIERWLAAHETHIKRTTAATYRTVYRAAIEPAFADLPLTDLRPIDVAEWLARLTATGKSPGWVRQCYRLLSQSMASAVDNDLLTASPCRGHRLPRAVDPEPVILSVAEVDRLIAATRSPFDVLMLVLGYGGLRIGEAFALRRRDVSGRVVTIARRKAEIAGRPDFDSPKSHQTRAVTLPDFVGRRLATHLDVHVAEDRDALLFVGARGGPLSYNYWRRSVFDPAAETAGLAGLTPHDLRASHASWVADSHGVLVAARRLGHANASVTTRHYARASQGGDELVADALDDEHDRSDGARGGHDRR